MGGSTVTELLDFTGGMNTLVAPHLISKREATSLINVDIRLGSLQSMPNLDHINTLLTGPFFYDYLGSVQDYNTFRSNVTWNNVWYFSDGLTVQKQLDEVSAPIQLGIQTPVQILTQAAGGTTTGPHTGDFKYTYTFYSSTTGVESAPAPLPNYITVALDTIILDNFEALPPEADQYRLYRVGGYLPTFTLVDTFPPAEVPYTDSLDDTKIDGRPLTTLYTSLPPAGLQDLVEMNGRFYGSVGNRVYFSALGNPDAWYITNYIEVPELITGLGKAPAGLLVFEEFSTSLLRGTQPTNFQLKVISEQLGCVGRESIAYIADSAVWLSHKSFCMSNGYKVTDITANKIDRINGLAPTSACAENETYYMSYRPSLYPDDTLFPSDSLYPDATDGTAGVDQGIVAIDFKRGSGFSYKMIEYDNIRSVGVIDGDVHVGTGSADDVTAPCNITMFPDCFDTLQCSTYALNRMNVYSGQGLEELLYVSPKLIDGSRATLKEYDKVRILFKGIFNIKVIFDNGKVVLDQDIASPTETDAFTLLGIPNATNKSYQIQFVITGRGTVESIQYSWKPRELVN